MTEIKYEKPSYEYEKGTEYGKACLTYEALEDENDKIMVIISHSPSSGERGIRTSGTSQFNGFQDRRNRPLCHLSK